MAYKQDPDGPPAYGTHVSKPSMEKNIAGPSTRSAYAIVILSESDKIRLLNFPPSIVPLIQQTLRNVWPAIQREGPTNWGAYEFKLRGYPWQGSGGEAVPSKRLMIHVLYALSSVGWHLAASVDMTKKEWDKDTLFFRSGPPVVRQFFAVTFNESDKVRLIDWPNDTVMQTFIQTVSSWPSGVQDQKLKEHGCYQFKLRGNPWYTNQGSQVGQARVLACNLLAAMDDIGYELAGTIDMNRGNEGADMDSWFFASKLH